jgi:hypothetical protein
MNKQKAIIGTIVLLSVLSGHLIAQSSGGNRSSSLPASGFAGLNKAGNPTPAIWAVAYGVKADSKFSTTATFTNGQNTIDCSFANDCNFTAADNGKICFGTTSSTNGTLVLPQGTLTVATAQTATCSGGNATGSTTHTGVFIWGSDDTTALQAADTAAGNACTTLQLPAGYMLTQAALFLTQSTSNCASTINGVYAGRSVYGEGITDTFLIVTPNFSFAGCTGGQSGKSCFFGTTSGTESDFTIWGGGNPVGGTHVVNLVEFGNGTRQFNVDLIGWCSTCASSVGMTSYSSQGLFSEGGVLYFGATQVQTGGSEFGFQLQGGFFQGPGVTLLVNSGTSAITYGNYFQGAAAGNGAAIEVAGTSWNYGDFFGCGSTCSDIRVDATGTVYLYGIKTAQQTGSGDNGIFLQASGAQAFVSGSSLKGVGTGGPINSVAGSKFYDLGGNTFSGGAGSSISGSYFGSASATGTGITAGAAVLSAGWGSTAAWTALAGANSFRGTITASGTGQAANPTITFTFPTPYQVAPSICNSTQVGGTQTQGTFATITGPSATAVTFTYSGTPGASNTIFVQVFCQ